MNALPKRLFSQRILLSFIFNDGRSISVPLVWYPRLFNAKKQELENYELIGDGEGIRWPDLDEDISIEGILAGRRSGESQKFS